MSINGSNIIPLLYTVRAALYLHAFTRQELAQFTGYSESSVYNHVRFMLTCGLVKETGEVTHADGRYKQACFTVVDSAVEPTLPKRGSGDPL